MDWKVARYFCEYEVNFEFEFSWLTDNRSISIYYRIVNRVGLNPSRKEIYLCVGVGLFL